MWAYGKVEKKDEGLCEAIGGRAIEESVLQKTIPQAIANILWAHGKFERKDGGVFEAIGRRAIEMTPQALANILWTYGNAEKKDEGVYLRGTATDTDKNR